MNRFRDLALLILARARQIFAGAVVVVFGVVVLFNAGSNLAETTDYRLAQRLNPINFDAVLARINTQLPHMTTTEKTAPVRNSALWAITLSPRDARGFSALGLARAAEGDLDTARALFKYALEISTSEPIALRWLAADAVRRDDYETALDHLAILSRRWPELYVAALPIYEALLRRPHGMAASLERHIVRTGKRSQLLSYLLETEEGTKLAAQYLLRLHQRGADLLGFHIVETERALFQFGHDTLAQSLFQFTLSERAQMENGFVFNGRFDLKPSGSPFDWSLVHSPGLAQTIENGALELEFLNAPSRIGSLRQTLMLPPGRYRLQLRLAAKGAQTPDPIYAEISCQSRLAARLISLPLPDGSYRSETFETEFDVPTGGCPLQRLQLTNRVSDLNWDRPNSGFLSIDDISIERITAQ